MISKTDRLIQPDRRTTRSDLVRKGHDRPAGDRVAQVPNKQC